MFLRVIVALFLAIFIIGTDGYASENTESNGENVDIKQTDIEITVPGFWSPGQRPGKPEIAAIGTIRFLTGTDFPPFNFIDGQGALVGFNVDLAREICRVLELECTIRATDWGSLGEELEAGRGDAIIAAMTLTIDTRARFDFTHRYMTTPARFATHKGKVSETFQPETLKGMKVGVIRNTAHAAYLLDFFPESEIVPFEDREALRKAIVEKDVEYMFDDGMAVMFWLNGAGAEGCCVFAGGPYTESRYFGEGIAIALAKGNNDLRIVLNYGLQEVHRRGKFLEIFLRHFPQSFY